MLLYALIPAVGALLAYTIYIRADDALQPGVYGGIILNSPDVTLRKRIEETLQHEAARGAP